MSQACSRLFLRGYRAFVAGDLDAIEGMLDPEVEWIGVGEVAAIADRADVLEMLRDRVAEDYHVTVDRCIGVGDDVVVSMRFSRVESDPTDERPLQSRRYVPRRPLRGDRHDARRARRARRRVPAPRGRRSRPWASRTRTLMRHAARVIVAACAQPRSPS